MTDTLDQAATNYPVLKSRKLIAAAEEYVTLTAQTRTAEKRLRELRTEIIAAMDGAPVAVAGRRTLNVTTTAPTPGTPDRVVGKEMLGQVLRGTPGRAGFQQLRVQ